MRKSLCGKVLLVSVWLLSSARGWTQAQPQAKPPTTPAPGSLNLALTISTERAEIAPNNCNCFIMVGGGFAATYSLPRGIGLVASITGGSAANVTPGIDVNKISYLGGGSYTYSHPARMGSANGALQLFGEGLFGEAHGFKGSYPTNGGLASSASSFAMQIGGGVDLFLGRLAGIRLVQADFVRTSLPNSYNNSQDDFRLAFGVIFRLNTVNKKH